MKAKFLNTSMAGSYWEPCELLGYTPFDPTKHGSTVDKMFLRLGVKTVEDFPNNGLAGALVEYYDTILDDNCEQWITLDRLDV